MELDRVEKPLRKMRKLLKSLPADPAPADVHKLRTATRRIEAAAGALTDTDRKDTRRLLKALKPVRKAAGSVRDMDVLTRNLLELPQNGTRESLLRLVEHLGNARQESAGELLDTVDRQRKAARRQIKKYERLVESVAESVAVGKKPVQRAVARTFDSENGSDSAADRLIAELIHWPALNAENFHPFRLKVKELRYVLQLFPQADQGFVNALGNVKDGIGDWHDWQQLQEIAREVLDAQKDRELLEQIEKKIQQKFTRALSAANALRRRYLHTAPARRKVS